MPPGVAPLAEIKKQLRDFIRRELIGNPRYPLADDDPLITGGLIDSFALAHIGVFIERAFDVYLLDTELTVENMNSVDQIAARVVRDTRGTRGHESSGR